MPKDCKNNKRLQIVLLIFLIPGIQNGFSQSMENISPGLKILGFENVRTLNYEGNIYVSIENNIYRWNPLAIAEALDLIAIDAADSSNLSIILTEMGIPGILISVNSCMWKEFRKGTISREQFYDRLEVTWEIKEVWTILKKNKPENLNTGKVDIVVYPQFNYENTLKSKIYETQFNIAPAVEFSAWKGNKFTGQVIFPIHNELGYEGDFIRPGFVTISQEFRLPKQWIGNFTAGNFNNSRYGFEIYLRHPFQNKNWLIELKTGLTGSSHFFDYQWTHTRLNTITWSSSVSWYYQRFNIVFKGGAEQYIYNDRGLFAICTRYFGETSVGFYALANEKNLNGGFIVTIPFPFKKRLKRSVVRLTIPDNFNFGYNAGTELYYSQNFRSNIDDNLLNSINFTEKFKNEIINLKK